MGYVNQGREKRIKSILDIEGGYDGFKEMVQIWFGEDELVVRKAEKAYQTSIFRRFDRQEKKRFLNPVETVEVTEQLKPVVYIDKRDINPHQDMELVARVAEEKMYAKAVINLPPLPEWRKAWRDSLKMTIIKAYNRVLSIFEKKKTVNAY